MEEPPDGRVYFSSLWRRDALRWLRRRRRRLFTDPLLASLLPRDGSPRACWRGVARRGMPKEVTSVPAMADIFLQLSFWRRIVGIVIVVAVISLLTWIALNPPKLLELEPCPDNWLYYKKKCYYHSEVWSPADWNSSQESCSKHGASLAVIESRQELNFIMYRIRVTDFWIGLHRKGNKFVWVNGEPLDTSLFQVNITNGGDCVHIDSTFISTRNCSSLRNWLCTIGQFNPKTSSN